MDRVFFECGKRVAPGGEEALLMGYYSGFAGFLWVAR